jgi:hypothetical protein
MSKLRWSKEDIQDLLRTNDRAVVRALLFLYSQQTKDEQEVEATQHSNGRGFNGMDANFLSSLAKQYQQRKFLSRKQIGFVRQKLMKYWRQLAERAEEVEARRLAEGKEPILKKQLPLLEMVEESSKKTISQGGKNEGET